MIASEIPAAIKPYSIAVAPDSSDKNLKKLLRKSASSGDVLKPSGATGNISNNLRLSKPARNNRNHRRLARRCESANVKKQMDARSAVPSCDKIKNPPDAIPRGEDGLLS
jgi:hypothetical protein